MDDDSRRSVAWREAPGESRKVLSFLALCARIGGDPGHQARLARAAAALDWDILPDRAEAHGLAPLVHANLVASPQAAGLSALSRTRGRLRGWCLQHAHASSVRTRALVEILALYRDLNIEVLLLKGAALAHLIYPRPALRPMRDIDLLVREADAVRAHTALATIGFTGPPSPMHGLPAAHHHLAGVAREDQGVSVSVEVHRGLRLLNERQATAGFEDMESRTQTMSVAGVPARTLGPEDLLWHVCRHAFNAVTREPLRFIWVADCITLVEREFDRFDWALLDREYPAIRRVLPVLHAVTPLRDEVAARLGLEPARATASGRRLRPFTGWSPVPRPPSRGALSGGLESRTRWLVRLAGNVLFPPDWWLRLAYGRGVSRVEYGRAWLAHLRMLAGTMRHVACKHGPRVASRFAARPVRVWKAIG